MILHILAWGGLYMSESIWEKDVFIPERNKLEDNIKTDVCIIGAGLAGILTG